MGKWLIWIMCLVGYGYALAQFELPTGCYVLFMIAALGAYVLWVEEDKRK